MNLETPRNTKIKREAPQMIDANSGLISSLQAANIVIERLRAENQDLKDRLYNRTVKIWESTRAVHVLPSGCIIWMGAVNDKGYGIITKNSKPAFAHRVAYQQAHGLIPNGLFACHRCDTPSCINPDHLFLGTNAENTADKMRKGRHVTNPLFGEQNSKAKLKNSDVERIRASRAKGQSLSVLAMEFGVSESTVSRICNRKTWQAAGH